MGKRPPRAIGPYTTTAITQLGCCGGQLPLTYLPDRGAVPRPPSGNCSGIPHTHPALARQAGFQYLTTSKLPKVGWGAGWLALYYWLSAIY